MDGPLEQEHNCDDSEQDRNDGFGVKFAQLAEAVDAKEKGDQNQGNQEVKDVAPAQTVDDPTNRRPGWPGRAAAG